MTRRSGPPCSGVSGSPSACVARSDSGSRRNEIGHVRGVALLGVRDDEVRGLERLHERLERAPVDALEGHVEAAPARDAVDVLGVGRPRERVQLVPREPDRVLDLSRDDEVPGREVGARDRAGVQDRPLLGQVLAWWQARRVVARLDDLSLRSAPEHGCNTSPMPGTAMRIGRTAARLRRRARARTPRRICRRWSRTTSRRSRRADRARRCSSRRRRA